MIVLPFLLSPPPGPEFACMDTKISWDIFDWNQLLQPGYQRTAPWTDAGTAVSRSGGWRWCWDPCQAPLLNPCWPPSSSKSWLLTTRGAAALASLHQVDSLLHFYFRGSWRCYQRVATGNSWNWLYALSLSLLVSKCKHISSEVLLYNMWTGFSWLSECFGAHLSSSTSSGRAPRKPGWTARWTIRLIKYHNHHICSSVKSSTESYARSQVYRQAPTFWYFSIMTTYSMMSNIILRYKVCSSTCMRCSRGWASPGLQIQACLQIKFLFKILK